MQPPRRRTLLGCLVATIAFVLLGPLSPAGATYPGSNGDIVYTRDSEIRAMASDGSGVVTYRGRMIENLHVDTARRTLATHEAIEARRG